MKNVSDYSLNKVSLDDKNIGFVVVPNTNKGKNSKESKDKSVGAYIPKLMSEIDMGDKPWNKKKTINSTMIKNHNVKIKFDPILTHRNYYEILPLRQSNIAEPALYSGEHFWVQFLDGDIKKARYETRFSDESLRSHDRYRIFVKDKPSVNSDDSREYEVLLDSDEQIIRIFMDNARGEKSKFTFEMNGKENHAKLSDDKGASIVLSNGSVTINAPNGYYVNDGRE